MRSKVRFVAVSWAFTLAASGLAWCAEVAPGDVLAGDFPQERSVTANLTAITSILRDAKCSIRLETLGPAASEAYPRSSLPPASIPVELLRAARPEAESQAVPEPASIALMSGLGGLMLLAYRLRSYFDQRAAG